MKERIYSESELNQKCAKYQKILRLEDWDIDVRLVDQRDIGGHDAQLRKNTATRKAYIQIPTPETWASGFSYNKQDMRASLIHELIHLVFAYADPEYKQDDVRHDLWESAIEATAQAFNALLDAAEANDSSGVA